MATLTKRNFYLDRTVAPKQPAASVVELRAHARKATSDEDQSLLQYLWSATEYLEAWLNRSLITQTWELALDGGEPADDALDLPRGPLQSVTSVVTYDEKDAATTFAASKYEVDKAAARIFLKDDNSWPTSLRGLRSFVVTYVAGYGAQVDDVPRSLRQAVLVIAAHLFEHREENFEGVLAELPLGAKRLAAPYRRFLT